MEKLYFYHKLSKCKKKNCDVISKIYCSTPRTGLILCNCNNWQTSWMIIRNHERQMSMAHPSRYVCSTGLIKSTSLASVISCLNYPLRVSIECPYNFPFSLNQWSSLESGPSKLRSDGISFHVCSRFLSWSHNFIKEFKQGHQIYFNRLMTFRWVIFIQPVGSACLQPTTTQFWVELTNLISWSVWLDKEQKKKNDR